MKLRKVSTLRGPNVWANFPVLEAWLDLENLKDQSSDALPGFNDRLQAWLPSLIEHRCSVGERGGFFERLRRGTYLAHIVEHVALELQSLAGTEVGFGRTRMANEDGVYKVAIAFGYEEVGRAALETAVQLCQAAVDDTSFDVAGEIEKLRDLVQRVQPPADVRLLLEAARKRRIPVQHLDADLIQLGYGKHQQRLLHGRTSRHSAVAEAVARDRERVWNMLWAVGVPVPDGRVVRDVESAARVGGRVVVKPKHGPRRAAKIVDASDRDALQAAFAYAARNGEPVLVEKFAEGVEFRVLVIGDRTFAARREPDGSYVDVTAELHADVATTAVNAARTLGLDVAGVDIVAPDLREPLEERGVVVGVTVPPALHVHGPAAAEAFLDWLMPGETTGRIPVVAVTGVNGKTTTTRFIAHLLGPAHGPVGMTCTEGIYLGSRRLATGDCSGPQSARVLLRDPRTAAVALECARGGILREGLGFDRCDVAVITNVGEGDHLGIHEIDTLEQLAYVKSTLVAAVAKTGYAVLNAEDPLVVDMAQWCKGQIIYFSLNEAHPVVVQHRRAGGRAAFLRDNHLILAQGDEESPFLSVDDVPLTHGGQIGFQVQNTLAAVAAAWGLGLPLDAVRAGVRTFGADLEQVPGRFNLLEINGISVVVDYGHNASALLALIDSLKAVPHGQRTIVYSSSGDRRDVDLVRQGEVLGDGFDRVVLYEDPRYLRGRPVGGITGPIREGLARGRRVTEVLEVRDWEEATKTALSVVRPGELLVVQPDVIDETVEFLYRFFHKGEGRQVVLNYEAAETAEDAKPSSVVYETQGTALEVRESRYGRGVFAVRQVEAGQVVLRGWGEEVVERERLTMQVDHDLHILPDAPMQFINHACEPNCGVLVLRDERAIEIHALRPIAPGEELSIDYSTFEYEIEHMTCDCACETPGCRGRIRGYRHLPAAVRARYGRYIAEYLREIEEGAAVVTAKAE